jgi:hypothetical protein
MDGGAVQSSSYKLFYLCGLLHWSTLLDGNSIPLWNLRYINLSPYKNRIIFIRK